MVWCPTWSKNLGRSLVLGPNNNKAIIRFYPYDDHQDRGACQIWKVILESRHCVYLTTLQLLIFTLAQTISNSNSNIHEQLSAIKRIKIDWNLKPFFNCKLVCFFIKWKAWNTRKKIFLGKLCAMLSNTWLSKVSLSHLKFPDAMNYVCPHLRHVAWIL